MTIKDTSSSVDRTLRLIEIISHSPNGVSLAEITEMTKIPKSTVFRLLEKLLNYGYVDLDRDTERYVPGLKAIDIGVSALLNTNIVDASIPYLRDLSEKTGETSFLGVHSEGEIVYLYKAEGTQAILTPSQLGSRRPVHCTGLGKAIFSGYSNEFILKVLNEQGMKQYTKKTLVTPESYLSEIEEVRRKGFAADLEELEIGLGCFAMPVYNFTAKVVGAICVSGPVERVLSNESKLISLLRESAQQVSKRLGFVPNMMIK
ncbi:IclR family transcriptional regulator [Alkalihalobacillus oceani]|uniref:IclR family transcriptional regulator n=1 Tax=Halalkalibacter oceani TaxID=1653776 RepID=UPI00203C611B|nr:IclR family transcriptional regulator [Halalkalibacter oceani]MCM3761337.1 IclR family transcriptional regulator [Halalkalibacter oceani]